MVVYNIKNYFNLFNELANTSLKELLRNLSIHLLDYELTVNSSTFKCHLRKQTGSIRKRKETI